MAVRHICPIAEVSLLGGPDILPFSGLNAEHLAGQQKVPLVLTSLVWLGRQINLRQTIPGDCTVREVISCFGIIDCNSSSHFTF